MTLNLTTIHGELQEDALEVPLVEQLKILRRRLDVAAKGHREALARRFGQWADTFEGNVRVINNPHPRDLTFCRIDGNLSSIDATIGEIQVVEEISNYLTKLIEKFESEDSPVPVTPTEGVFGAPLPAKKKNPGKKKQ